MIYEYMIHKLECYVDMHDIVENHRSEYVQQTTMRKTAWWARNLILMNLVKCAPVLLARNTRII